MKTQISKPLPRDLIHYIWNEGPGTCVLVRSQVIPMQMVLKSPFVSTSSRPETETLLAL